MSERTSMRHRMLNVYANEQEASQNLTGQFSAMARLFVVSFDIMIAAFSVK